MTAAPWFEVDRKGLGKLIERRRKIWLLHELIANAWDADGTTRVDVELEPVEGEPKVWVRVIDDSPNGFADLRHAWTMFAESSRKGTAEKRGRFNLGEKLVLALCDEAAIYTTTGGVTFGANGRKATREKREAGSEFWGCARITRAELAEIREQLALLISPAGITTIIDGVPLRERKVLRSVSEVLPTEIADNEGVLRRSSRRATVDIVETDGDAWLYEMGIPVVETGDRWSVNVLQKVPLNMDRDNVTPAYLRYLRTLVVNAMHDQLTPADANATYVNEALADEDASPEAVKRALDLKYTEKRAIFDPSDPEANMNLVSQGYTLIHGSQLTKEQWSNVRKHEAARPSGQLAPTKKALFSPDGVDRWVPREKWTRGMVLVVNYAERIGRELLGREIHASILSDITAHYGACFGGSELTFNVGRLSKVWFETAFHQRGDVLIPTQGLNKLLIHEFGHGMPGGENHLSESYHDGLCELGARLAQLALSKPELFRV